MTVRIYRSSDTSAPVLNGNSGSLITLLDALLVNGYGTQTALGWTKAFTGTNKASYKQPVGTTNGFYLDIDDSTSDWTGSNGFSARVRGYETMTAVGTGTNPFPTTAQSAAGASLWIKSQEALAATAVNWVAVGTNKFFYLWIRTISTNNNATAGDYGAMWAFGDFLSNKAGDVYNTLIVTSSAASLPYSSYYNVTQLNTATGGHFVTRGYQQTGTSITGTKLIDWAKSGANTGMGGTRIGGTNPNTALPYPNPVDANLYLSPIWLANPSAKVLRGTIPGSYAPCHWFPVITGTQVAGTGTFAGKTFEAFSIYNGDNTVSGAGGQVFIEVSNTW